MSEIEESDLENQYNPNNDKTVKKQKKQLGSGVNTDLSDNNRKNDNKINTVLPSYNKKQRKRNNMNSNQQSNHAETTLKELNNEGKRIQSEIKHTQNKINIVNRKKGIYQGLTKFTNFMEDTLEKGKESIYGYKNKALNNKKSNEMKLHWLKNKLEQIDEEKKTIEEKKRIGQLLKKEAEIEKELKKLRQQNKKEKINSEYRLTNNETLLDELIQNKITFLDEEHEIPKEYIDTIKDKLHKYKGILLKKFKTEEEYSGAIDKKVNYIIKKYKEGFFNNINNINQFIQNVINTNQQVMNHKVDNFKILS